MGTASKKWGFANIWYQAITLLVIVGHMPMAHDILMIVGALFHSWESKGKQTHSFKKHVFRP